MKAHTLYKFRATTVTADDLSSFDFVLAMDQSNLPALHALQSADSMARVQSLESYDPQGCAEITDPFEIGTADAFNQAFAQIERSCLAFLAEQEAQAVHLSDLTGETRHARSHDGLQ